MAKKKSPERRQKTAEEKYAARRERGDFLKTALFSFNHYKERYFKELRDGSDIVIKATEEANRVCEFVDSKKKKIKPESVSACRSAIEKARVGSDKVAGAIAWKD